MRLKVKVTQEHIDKGVPEEGDSCAVALALRECSGVFGTQRVYVDQGVISLGDLRLRTPDQVSKFVDAYDAAKLCPSCGGDGWIGDGPDCEDCAGKGFITPKVEPFEFELDLDELKIDDDFKPDRQKA